MSVIYKILLSINISLFLLSYSAYAMDSEPNGKPNGSSVGRRPGSQATSPKSDPPVQERRPAASTPPSSPLTSSTPSTPQQKETPGDPYKAVLAAGMHL